MAAKKKPKSKAKPKRLASKPKSKAKPAPKRAQRKAKPAATPKKAKSRVGAATPQPKEGPAQSPKPVAAPLPQSSPVIVRPGLQKRADAMPIGIVRVTDDGHLIEESTFYSASGRDEYVQRWEARGYTCRFTPTNH